MALALATLIAWLLVAAAVVALGRLRHDAEWAPWDVLRGVRALAVGRLSDSLTLRLAMVGAGHEWSRQAQEAGHLQAQSRLSAATLNTTRVLVRQLDDELAGYAQHARVLQAATPVELLRAPELQYANLQRLAWGERALAVWLGPVTRLRLHLWTLRRALRYLGRRCDAGASADATDMLTLAAQVHTDLSALARATVAAYHALLASLDQSRRRLAVAHVQPRGPGGGPRLS